MTDHQQEIYYLKSILNNLRDLRKIVHETNQGATISGEVLADNIDWLDCHIAAIAAAKEGA